MYDKLRVVSGDSAPHTDEVAFGVEREPTPEVYPIPTAAPSAPEAMRTAQPVVAEFLQPEAIFQRATDISRYLEDLRHAA